MKKLLYKYKLLIPFIIFFIFLFPSSIFAADCPVEDGGVNDGDGIVNGVITINSNTTWTADATNQGDFDCSNYDILVTNSSVLTLDSYDNGDTDYTNDYPVKISIADLTVDSGSKISGDYKGYSGGGLQANGYGPGGGNGAYESGGGGGYAGSGGYGTSGGTGGSTYGKNVFSLSDLVLGSGGGGSKNCGGGAGGGAIYINSSGSVIVNGDFSVNGQNACENGNCPGGGSGGAILIETSIFSGSGNINANGGTTNQTWRVGGGGGGGRIQIKYSNANSFSGTMSANGGTTPVSGNNGEDGAIVFLDSENNDLYIKNSMIWDANPLKDGVSHTYRDIFIQNSSVITIKGYYTDNTDGVGIVFNCDNFTIESGSSILAKYGYAGRGAQQSGLGEGAGGGGYESGCGGGYGGVGGKGQSSTGSPGVTYGNEAMSTGVKLGSSGGGGKDVGGSYGGSAVSILAKDTISLGGNINANGTNSDPHGNQPGAGSGGSVYLKAQVLSGSGDISANGGASTDNWRDGGSGGGGRVAIFYYDKSSYTGSVTANKGAGVVTSQGADGSVAYFNLPGLANSLNQYKVDGITAVDVNSQYGEDSIILKTSMEHSSGSATLTPKFEIQKIGTEFTNTATHTGDSVSYTGTEVTGQVTVTSLSDLTGYHWQAQVCDDNSVCSDWVSYGDNEESVADFQVKLNTTPNLPSSLGSTSLVNGSWIVDNTPTFEFNITDPDDSDQVKYQIIIDNDSDFSSPVIYYTSSFGNEGSKTFNVGQSTNGGTYAIGSEGQTLEDGSYYWKVKSFDDDGESSEYVVANSSEIAFKVDSTKPTGSIHINLGDEYTNINDVSLLLSATDSSSGITSMMICNNSNFTGCTWEIYSTSKSWNLTNGDGNKTVYVKYKDFAGNESITYSENIILDTEGPNGSVSINSGSSSTSNRNVSLNISATDTNSSVVSMMVCNSEDFLGCDWEVYSTSKSWIVTSSNGTKTVYVKFKDALGNESVAYSDSITLYTPVIEEEEEIVEDEIEVETEEEINIPEVTEEEAKEVLEVKKKIKKEKDIDQEEGVALSVGNKKIVSKGKKKVHVYSDSNIELSIPKDVLLGTNTENDVEDIYVVLGESVARLVLDISKNEYVGSIVAKDVLGTQTLDIVTLYKNGDAEKNVIDVAIDPYGYVYYINNDGNQVRLHDAKVTLYEVVKGERVLYEVADQTNPQYTNTEGEYSFMVEPGTYVLTVEIDGYGSYDSGEFEVEKTIIEMNIELEKDSNLLTIALVVLGSIGLLSLVFVIFKKN